MDGLLLVNKPSGISSFDVIRRLRRITGQKKIGHAGTLDPMATGLMIMLVGSATKRAGELVKLDKEYVAEITLGANSSTGDREGMLTAVDDREPSKKDIEKALKLFRGSITQTPPIYSAIKIDGKEAYKLARAGKTPEMPKRQVTIYSIELLNYDYPKVEIKAKVSSGTYIRTLAEDIGKELGTGGYLTGLVRTRVGEFALEQAVDIEDATKNELTFHESLTRLDY